MPDLCPLTCQDIDLVLIALRDAEPKFNRVATRHWLNCKCPFCSAAGLVADAISDLSRVRRQLVAATETPPF